VIQPSTKTDRPWLFQARLSRRNGSSKAIAEDGVGHFHLFAAASGTAATLSKGQPVDVDLV
jgi:hypothetical protein